MPISKILAMFCCFKTGRPAQPSLPASLRDVPADVQRYVPRITSGLVTNVYDGDTFTVVSRVVGDPTLYKFSVRIAGIDCPELRSKIPSEKEAAALAKDRVENLIYARHVKLENVRTEKYGRILADVYVDYDGGGVSVGNFLIREKLAVKYDGKRKNPPADWMCYFRSSMQ